MERVVFVITLVFGTLMAAPQREQLSKIWSDHAINHQDVTLCLEKFGILDTRILGAGTGQRA